MKRTVNYSLLALAAFISLWHGNAISHDSDNDSADVVHNSKYSGSKGKEPVTAHLKFLSNDHVIGSYTTSYGQKYLLKGHNHTEGKIFLREYTQEDGVWSVTASFTLRKKIQSGKVVWSGLVTDIDGQEYRLIFRKVN